MTHDDVIYVVSLFVTVLFVFLLVPSLYTSSTGTNRCSELAEAINNIFFIAASVA